MPVGCSHLACCTHGTGTAPMLHITAMTRAVKSLLQAVKCFVLSKMATDSVSVQDLQDAWSHMAKHHQLPVCSVSFLFPSILPTMPVWYLTQNWGQRKTLFLNKALSFIDTPKILVMITGRTSYTQTNLFYRHRLYCTQTRQKDWLLHV